HFIYQHQQQKNGEKIKKEDNFEEEKEENFVVSTILKALIKCKKPEIEIDPVVLSYVGSNFKCWHIALLKLEKIAISKKALISNIGGEITTSAWNAAANLTEEKLDTLDSLTRLYQYLNEFDQYNFVWRKRACFEKTIKCLAFYQQGDFVRARETAEKLMLYLNEKLFKSDSLNAVTPAILSEFQVFEHCWIDSCKQLNDWTSLEAFSNSDEVANINLLTETAWHLSDWKLLKDCLIQLDAAGDPSMTIKSSLYKLMINIANFDQLDFRPILNKEFNGKAFVEINKMLITNWKKLPSIISHSHLEILNLAHFTHEVCESANVINNNLQSINFPSHQQQQQNGSSSSSTNNLNTSVKHLLKSWRSRPITNIDQLNSLVDLFTWRSQFFCSILNFYENTDQKSLLTLPVHTLAQTQIQLSRMLRRSNQLELAQNELNKLHSSILVHPIDIHLKLVEHIKCLLRLSSNEFIQSSSSTTTSVKRSINAAQDALIEALNLIEGVQLNVLKRDQISRLMICKGIVLSKLDKREEAGRAFSAAAQLDHDLLGGTSVWKHWGDFLTSIFMSNINENSAQITGIQAIACTLEHAKISPSPLKARLSIAKFLWLIKILTSFGGSEKILISLNELLEKYVDNETINPSNWLFWLVKIIIFFGKLNNFLKINFFVLPN
uniref:PIK-related kinase FAT domain-containing protein n=1 Tax=Meloidogyne incognita TaxID=6306 RepID=A0A914NQC6_MELIC